MPRHRFCYTMSNILATPLWPISCCDVFTQVSAKCGLRHIRIAQALSFGHNARSLNYEYVCGWLWLLGGSLVGNDRSQRKSVLNQRHKGRVSQR
jgi:hypothetical protein